MKRRTSTSPEAQIVDVDEDLDVVSAAGLAGMIGALEAADGAIVVSLEACPFCDSAGLTALLRASKRLGSRFRLVLPARAPARRVFDILDVAKLPFVFGSLAEALGATA
jgi:anti-anti-sigma factor